MFDELSPALPNSPGVDEWGATIFEEQNKGVTPVFLNSPIHNEAKSAVEGRPIFDSIEICHIYVAGDPFNQSSCPVDDKIKQRFPNQYRAWKEKGEGRKVTGTPLRSWPLLTSANVAEFEALHIFNVEGLAAIADTSISKAQGLREWREKAKAWLASAKDGAASVKYAAENAQLRDDLAATQADMKRLIERITDLEAKKAK